MDRDEFTGVKTPVWWLLELRLDSEALQQKRDDVGICWGWTDSQWFTQPDKIGAVYDFLGSHRNDLLVELDHQADDPYVRSRWLDELIKSRTPADKAEKAVQPAAPATQGPAAPPTTQKPADATATETPAEKKPSPFARRRTAAETTVEQGADTPVATKASAPTATAEPRRPSPFARKAASTEPAAQAPGADREGPAEGMGTVIKEVLSEASVNVSDLAAELGIAPTELTALMNDPEFEQMVADEASKLLADQAG